jgi:hypothetical protein
MNKVFISGMFRSGTTLISRMIQSHPEIACASDPFAPIFKAFRNQFASKSKYSIDFESPLDDFYFNEKVSFFHELQKTSLKMSSNNLDWDTFLIKIATSLKPYSPLLIPHLYKLEANNFLDILSNGFKIIQETYGNNDTKLVGFKEVWTNEFGMHILRDFPESKVVHVIRDPRSILASNHASNEPYPIIFLARQWRKACASAIYQKKFSDYKDRVFILRYEDLITHPDIYISSLCSFLEVSAYKDMFNPETFLDGNNDPWIQRVKFLPIHPTLNKSKLQIGCSHLSIRVMNL